MSDDDIEIVDRRIADESISGTNDFCQLCTTNLHGLSDTERLDHYNKHSNHQTVAQQPRPRGSKPDSVITAGRKLSSMKFRKSAENAAKEDVFWYPAQGTAPPDNYAPGVLSILKEALKKSYAKRATQRAILCYERTPHIYRETFDVTWGCGYRNFLMTCAALMDQRFQLSYSDCLEFPLPPGVRNLQKWIEDAWKDGYDDIGARDFSHELVNTKKQLGTGELYVAFTSRKIPCTLVEFDLENSQKGFDTLTEWVVNYFTEKPEGDVNKILRTASPVMATGKMPVIMQYDGHSVTIVGYELAKNGKYNLFVFDPSSKVPKDIREVALNVFTDVNWASSSSPTSLSKRGQRSKSPALKKRPRTSEDPNSGIISIPDSDDEKVDDAHRGGASKSTLVPDTVIKAFRLKGLKSKRKQYQLLYFTMDDPLSDQEQNDRKVVFSVAEC